jgi:hypothetical protein
VARDPLELLVAQGRPVEAEASQRAGLHRSALRRASRLVAGDPEQPRGRRPTVGAIAVAALERGSERLGHQVGRPVTVAGPARSPGQQRRGVAAVEAANASGSRSADASSSSSVAFEAVT